MEILVWGRCKVTQSSKLLASREAIKLDPRKARSSDILLELFVYVLFFLLF